MRKTHRWSPWFACRDGAQLLPPRRRIYFVNTVSTLFLYSSRHTISMLSLRCFSAQQRATKINRTLPKAPGSRIQKVNWRPAVRSSAYVFLWMAACFPRHGLAGMGETPSHDLRRTAVLAFLLKPLVLPHDVLVTAHVPQGYRGIVGEIIFLESTEGGKGSKHGSPQRTATIAPPPLPPT